jgi:benzoylformate decarboxylase
MGDARMTGLPGVVLVHITPGIAHTIGNLFNAWRSQVPVIILCAQQQNELVTQEPLLSSNLVDLAKQYTKWAHEVRTPAEIKMVLQRAFKEALAPPNGPVFISIPWEYTMVEVPADDHLAGITRISPRLTGDPQAIADAAALLAAAKSPIIVAGDEVGYTQAWAELQQLAELIGAPVVLQSFSSVANFPNNDDHWQGELPGSQGGMQQVFKGHDVAFMVGWSCQAQVTVFKYSDGPLIPPSVRQIHLSNSTWEIGKNYFAEVGLLGDPKSTLPLICGHIGSQPSPEAAARNAKMKVLGVQRRLSWDKYIVEARQQKEIWAVLVADALRHEIAERQLERQFVYVHEAVSDPAPFQYLLPFGTGGGEPISYYCVAGGSLGWSMPASLGIKLNAKGHQGIGTRLVVNAVGDGSSLFYPQTYWTAAHEGLAVLYIITNNHEYHTLQLGLQTVIGAYGSAPGYNWNPKTTDPDYLRIERPKMDFVSLAQAFSAGQVQGEVVEQPDQVAAAVRRGVEHVLGQKSSYILDVRTAQNTPTTPSTADADADPKAAAKALLQHALKRYQAQPQLNVFQADKAGKSLRQAPGSPADEPNLPHIS